MSAGAPSQAVPRYAFPVWARALAVPAALLLVGCLQSDQKLPFELDEGASVSRSIGATGGVLSLASGVALVIPAGALRNPTQITLTPRLDAAFPGDAGRIIPGTVFDVAPADLVLLVPARVTLRLPTRNVPSSDAVRLGVARASGGRSNLVASGSYDATSGLLTASLSALGPVAAVVADDAIPLGTGKPPTLGGGSFGSGPSGAPALADAGMQRFEASCRPEARRCFSSGLVQLWASSELLNRLGGNLVILSPRLEADLSFGSLGAGGLPGEAVGRLSIRGTLRVQLGQGVSSYEVDETFRTGAGSPTPAVTTVRVVGNRLILARTSDGNDRTMEYSLQAIGTGRLLTLRVEEEVELENDDGSKTKGTVIVFVRLRG